ncbi:hypothetical protein GCM10018781_50680 [Kitasatospora indigofera]|uniref:Uncharacterized protein n=1 Tax=Kitasatospora indigofera TaxID=67307 RepID=A0A919G4A3_9ACTN|nr:hypothetical protein GCM10018781_50680 [Kitasatospora indigofera]
MSAPYVRWLPANILTGSHAEAAASWLQDNGGPVPYGGAGSTNTGVWWSRRRPPAEVRAGAGTNRAGQRLVSTSEPAWAACCTDG